MTHLTAWLCLTLAPLTGDSPPNNNAPIETHRGFLEAHRHWFTLHMPDGRELTLSEHDWRDSQTPDFARQNRLLRGHIGCRVIVTGRREMWNGAPLLGVLAVQPWRP